MKIGVDFDCTLAFHDIWRGVEHTGAPIYLMVQRVKEALAAGHEVWIFTARITCSPEYPGNPAAAVAAVEAWSLKNFGQVLPVTNIKGVFDQFWDDRAREVIPNTGLMLRDHLMKMLKHFEETGQQQSGSDVAKWLREHFEKVFSR
jgi:hypothetical protein